MAISNMQQPQQIQGGLGSLQDPRQRYFLGKLVKKAKRAVKKVTKSPLGKMAILGGLGMIPFGASGASLFGRLGSTGIGGLLKSGAGSLFNKGLTGFNNLSLGKKLFLGAGAASMALPFLMGGGDDEVEEEVDMQDPAAQVQRARNYYSGQGDGGAGLDFMPQKKYVMSNFYAADGGRAGYANGQLVTPSGDGSRPGYSGERVSTEENLFRTLPRNTNDRFLLPDSKPPKDKFGFMYETGPITERNLEILKNMTEEERRLFEERGSPFDIIEKFIDIPFQIRGEEIIKEKYAQGGRAGYAGGMLVDEDDEEEELNRSRIGMSRRLNPAFLNMGGSAGQAQAEQMLMMEYVKYKNKGGDLSFEQFVKAVMQQAAPEGAGMEQPQPVMMAADGGRIGYAGGQLVGPSGDGSRPGYAGESDIGIMDVIKSFPNAIKGIFSGETETFLGDNQGSKNQFTLEKMFPNIDQETLSIVVDLSKKGMGIDEISTLTGQDSSTITNMLSILNMKADGGPVPDSTVPGYTTPAGYNKFDYRSGGVPVRVGAQEGGIMATDEASEMIDMGGMEKDFRNEGGFVAMGGKERADDVPARLSKNEFVFTADAVRNAGGGDIDAGAEVMENLMNNLEQGGQVSEDSQGLQGAQEMYDQQQMLQSRIV